MAKKETTTISVSKETRDRMLRLFPYRGDSYESIIQKLLDQWEGKSE